METKKNEYDEKLFAEIVFPTFVYAYIHNADLNTDVYGKFMHRMQKDNTPLNVTRKKILNNCLHFFDTNPVSSELSSKQFTETLLSNSPEIILGENTRNYLEVVALPKLLESYLQGTDIKPVFDKLMKSIANDGNSQNIEKRKVLENCFCLLRNTRSRDEFDNQMATLRKKVIGREPSYEEFSAKFVETFLETVLTTNKKDFAKMILPSFLQSYVQGSDVKLVYEKFINRLSNDNTPTNGERRKVLENCLDLFKNVSRKKELDIELDTLKRTLTIDDQEPSEEEFVAKALNHILETFPEAILGDNKRKYDMSDLYWNGIIIKNSLRYIPVAKNDLSENCVDEYSFIIDTPCGEIILQKEGTLRYRNTFGEDDSITKYTVLISVGGEIQNVYKDIFTHIDEERIQDPLYVHALIKELFTPNNVGLANVGGYIGEIHCTEKAEIQLNVLDEMEEDTGFYRYQVSPKYALRYNREYLSAVMDYTRQLGQPALPSAVDNQEPEL